MHGIEIRGGAGLTYEAAARARLIQVRRREHFDGNVPIEERIVGEIDGAPRSRAQRTDDAVMREVGVRECLRSWRSRRGECRGRDPGPRD